MFDNYFRLGVPSLGVTRSRGGGRDWGGGLFNMFCIGSPQNIDFYNIDFYLIDFYNINYPKHQLKYVRNIDS